LALRRAGFPARRSIDRKRLLALHRLGYIRLARSDVLGTELLRAPPLIADQIQAEARPLSEYLGPLVLDHSRLDHAVLGSSGDSLLLDEVLDLLFPGKTLATASFRIVRDAMHVAWSIRFAFDALITEDRRLLKRDAAFRERFGFMIVSPAAALIIALRLQGRAEIRASSVPPIQ
jgi:hypothetical protein